MDHILQVLSVRLQTCLLDAVNTDSTFSDQILETTQDVKNLSVVTYTVDDVRKLPKI